MDYEMFIANCTDVLKTIQESCKTFESLIKDFCQLVRYKYPWHIKFIISNINV